jgi:ornithine cyclodeaminase
MPDGPLWIGEQEAADLLSLEDAIDVLAGAYRLQAGGEAATMRRAHLREGDAILHAVGGTIAGQGIAGTKTWIYTPGGAEPLIVLFSLDDGRVIGLVEAFALGQMRTAATSGLGTRVLARADAGTLALLGTGKQAFAQAQAMTCVRPLERIRLFGRDPDRRRALAQRLRATRAFDVSEHATVAEAVAGADVVTAITRSAEPILGGDLLEPGMHVNAVGAIVPARRELDALAVGRADVVVVDSVDQARDDAGELRAAAEVGLLDWATVRGLDAVIDDTPDRARFETDITLFKALGVGLSDVALGGEVLRRAVAAGAGQLLPTIPAAHQ